VALSLTTADDGSRRSVDVGDRVTVSLPENPTTGYRWQVDVDDAVLRLVDDRFEAPTEARGASGRRVLVFDTARPGTTTLRLENRRRWGTDPPAEAFAVDLDVGPR